MLHFQLLNTLKITQELEWHKLAHEVLGANVHPGRVQGFCLARAALKECFFHEGITLAIHELQMDHHDALKGYPTYTLSLSHTPLWGAAVLGSRTKYRSLGVDIEPQERVVKPFVLERISNQNDKTFSPIELWSLKEATFKALMNTRQFSKPEEFSSIEIHDQTWRHPPSGFEGEWQLDQQNGLVIATAWMRAQG